MMERKYQLVAWTENITDRENARLYMIPSLECEVQADLVSYSYFCGELSHEFIRLCEEGMRLAKKFRREDVLQEGKPKRMLEMYYEQTQEERDLKDI